MRFKVVEALTPGHVLVEVSGRVETIRSTATGWYVTMVDGQHLTVVACQGLPEQGEGNAPKVGEVWDCYGTVDLRETMRHAGLWLKQGMPPVQDAPGAVDEPKEPAEKPAKARKEPKE